jgi:hypothetical protein
MRASFGVVCLSIGLVGCGGGADDGRVKVFPTQGKVSVSGRPAEGAKVTFYSANTHADGKKVPPPTGTADATGVFQLGTYKSADGAPPGEYKVTVVWLEPPPANAQGIFDLKDRLQGRYSSPEKTTLKAQIPDGGGEIPPFELK